VLTAADDRLFSITEEDVMVGVMFALGIILGVVIAAIVVAGSRRRSVDRVFPIALGIAAIVALLALLTGHGLLGIGAAAILGVGEAAGLVGSAVVGGRMFNAMDQNR
jgi:MFS family permease